MKQIMTKIKTHFLILVSNFKLLYFIKIINYVKYNNFKIPKM